MVGATSQSAGDRAAAVTAPPSRSAADRTSATDAVPGAAATGGVTNQPGASSGAAEQGPPGLTITRPGFTKLPSSGARASGGEQTSPATAVSPDSAAAPESRIRWRRFVPTPANQGPAQNPALGKVGQTQRGHFSAAPAPATQPAISGAQVGGHPSGSEALGGLRGKPAPAPADQASVPGEGPRSLHQQGITPRPIGRQPGAVDSPRSPGGGDSRIVRELPPAKQPYLGTVKESLGRKN